MKILTKLEFARLMDENYPGYISNEYGPFDTFILKKYGLIKKRVVVIFRPGDEWFTEVIAQWHDKSGEECGKQIAEIDNDTDQNLLKAIDKAFKFLEKKED